MKRRYLSKLYVDRVNKIKEIMPQACIGVDVIVGFPGETEDQFERTYEHLRDWPIDYFHVFSYSDRHMAKGKGMDNPVPTGIIKERSQRLRSLSQRKRKMFYQSLVGSSQRVLFEQHKNGLWQGYTDHYVRVGVVSDKNLTHQILDVQLESVGDNIVMAKRRGGF